MKQRLFSEVLDSIPSSGIRKFFDLVSSQKDIISLGVGEPDFVTPWAIREEGIYALEKGLTAYTSNHGLLELREKIAVYLKHHFHCDYDPGKEIMITVGVSEGLDIALRTLLNPGDEVLIPEPSYVSYAPLSLLAGGKVKLIDTSKTGFILEARSLEQHLTPKSKAIILCSPNNPTGMVIPEKELQAIARLCKKHGIWVISDEIYAELCYDDSYTSYASLPNIKEKTVLLNGFSKGFAMTGWRLGYACGSSEFISRAVKIHQYSMLCAPTLSQYAAIEALKLRSSEVQTMAHSYQQRRNFIVGQFNKAGLPTPFPGGAFYCFPSIRSTRLTSEAFAMELLKQEKVAVVPGTAFGKSGEGHIRCCYATNSDLIKEAMVRIERFVKNLKRK